MMPSTVSSPPYEPTAITGKCPNDLLRHRTGPDLFQFTRTNDLLPPPSHLHVAEVVNHLYELINIVPLPYIAAAITTLIPPKSHNHIENKRQSTSVEPPSPLCLLGCRIVVAHQNNGRIMEYESVEMCFIFGTLQKKYGSVERGASLSFSNFTRWIF
ncbi:DNA glycosylase [Sesbania bispinosa]|nr:DNA glycosylase [Sesbania bispinosa]